MARAAGRRPGAAALEWAGGRWSYRELDAAAAAVATGLRQAEVGDGSAVACLLPSSPAAVAAAHGIPRAGAAVAFADARWTEPEIEAFLEGLGPAALLLPAGEAPSRPGWVTAGPAVAVRLPGDVRAGLWLPDPETAPSPRAELRGVHSVVWTSGSAGRGRGVRLSGAAHRASAWGAIRRLSLAADDRWLASLSPSHVGGLALWLRTAATGARLVLPERGFDAGAFVTAAAAGHVTHASLVPAMLHQVVAAAPDGAPAELRCALVGGAATAPRLLADALAGGWPVALTYGLTEAASQVATAPPPLVRRKPGTVGAPLAGVRVRIGENDEIRVKGPTTMLGYLGGDRAGEWLRTGDLGRLDEEGHLWVTGRAGLRLVSGGEVVDPQAVEAVLAEAPGVAEAAVTAVEDPAWGELVVAVIVPRPEARPAHERSREGDERSGGRVEHDPADALEAFARGRLSGARRPRAWIFVEALPRGARGKLDRGALRRLAAERLPSAPGAAPKEGDGC